MTARSAWLLAAFAVWAARGGELLTPKEVTARLFAADNPYYDETLARYRVVKAGEEVALGAFDTRLDARYEEKSYPLSSARYESAGVSKALANGTQLSVGYRKARGTQEYNNIKTGEDGEMIATMTLPLVNIYYDTSARETAYRLRRLQSRSAAAESAMARLRLYESGMEAYYRYLYDKSRVRLLQALVATAQKRVDFVRKKVEEGTFAPVEELEARAQLSRRRRTLLEARRRLQRSGRTLARLLDLDYETLRRRYETPALSYRAERLPTLATLCERARRYRPEWRQLAAELARVESQKRLNATRALPDLEVGLSGVYDMAESRNGYKVTTRLSLPLERRAYRGEKERLQSRMLMLQNLKARLSREIETELATILEAIGLQRKSLEQLRREVELYRRLERAEAIKYREGVGNLEALNRREESRLQSETKLFATYYELQLLRLRLAVESGRIRGIPDLIHQKNEKNKKIF